MKVRLDRTLCDGFGVCAKHAPKHFSLDDWGYATLEGSGDIDPTDQAPVLRALLDCPAHAILATPESATAATPSTPPADEAAPHDFPSDDR